MAIEDRSGRSAAWGVAAAVCVGVLAIVWPMAGAEHSTFPWWPTYVGGGLLVIALYMCFASIAKWPPFRESSAIAVVAPPAAEPVVTDRWRYTSEGMEVPGLMTLASTQMSHPGYGGQQGEPPTVKVGVILRCEPIDASSPGSALRATFSDFLRTTAVHELIRSLTHVPAGASWTKLAGRGTLLLEAALTTGGPADGAPVASALFLPPTAQRLNGRPEGTATLLLHIQPRTADGQVPPASDLATWYGRIVRALEVPGAFANFLSSDLGLATFGAPPAQFGFWLESQNPLSAMVDTTGLETLAGAWSSNQFLGWAYAAPDGKAAAGVAHDLMVHMCEYDLKLDSFESALPNDVA